MKYHWRYYKSKSILVCFVCGIKRDDITKLFVIEICKKKTAPSNKESTTTTVVVKKKHNNSIKKDTHVILQVISHVISHLISHVISLMISNVISNLISLVIQLRNPVIQKRRHAYVYNIPLLLSISEDSFKKLLVTRIAFTISILDTNTLYAIFMSKALLT